MPRRLLFALLVLVAAPLALLGWLTATTYQQQQEAAREQLQGFFESRLAEFDNSLEEVFDGYERDLDQSFASDLPDIATLGRVERQNPAVRATCLVNARGLLIYPPAPNPNSTEKVALFASLPAIVGSRPDLTSGAPTDGIAVDKSGARSRSTDSSSLLGGLLGRSSQSGSRKSAPTEKKMSAPTPRSLISVQRWQTWYLDEGLQLIYWVPQSDGAAIGVLLERARWVADLTAALPDSRPSVPIKSSLSSARSTGFTALTDESKQIVYRWGDNSPRGEQPLASWTLSAPLTGWTLEYHSNDPLTGTASTAVVISLAGIGVVLLALGAYVLTGVQRQMRSARNRVSFASQVSHELRTPLTNIRLYAELAEADLEHVQEGESKASIGRRLQVIDSESRRLGRLVSGVLEMIRDSRKPQGPLIAPVVPDEVIEQTLLQFEPSFNNAELQVQRDLDASKVVGLDSDILEMVLVNLLSNVEKYAADGESVSITSRMQGDQLVVLVTDQGPGIPKRQRRTVFRPFARLDDSIRAPSGTGIGLTIARRFAGRHGGQLEIVDSERGASFELRLPTKTVNEGQSTQD